MNFQSLVDPSPPWHGYLSAARSPTQPLSPNEKILIPCEIDRSSGSSSEARRRKANAEASRRFRRSKRQGIPLQVGMLSMRVFRLQKDQEKFVVYPPDHILVQCRALFGSERSEFTPEQVFIVIQKMSTTDADFREEIDFLLRIMQTRLCLPGVFSTDEGRFIRLAIAFSRFISLSGVQPLHHGVLEKGARLVDLQSVIPGIWEIKVRSSSSKYVTPMRGSLEQLMERIHYEDAAFSPPPPRTLDLNYEI